jgi:hypothetical protein
MADNNEFTQTKKLANPVIKQLDDKKKNQLLQVAGLGQNASNTHGNEGVYINSDFYRNDIIGKPYPGRVNLNTQRVLAYNSTVVRAILTLRSHQIAKLPITIIPSNSEEPPRQMNILDYNIYQLDNHPAFDDPEKEFLKKSYYKLDPDAFVVNKKKVFEENPDLFTVSETSVIRHLQKKHDDFYSKRQKDKHRIMGILRDPDPWFTNIRSWEKLAKSFLMDMLVIDRGVIVKLRDANGELRGLMPIDGATLRPVINKFGTFNDDYAYVQVVHGSPHVYLKKDDVIILMMNPMTDLKYFGYGLSNMETLYTAVLSDIFIDKGNLDFYRKGGSIPEGFISIEPPPSREGMIQQIDQEQLETIQRHLQAIMMGDFTQVPIVSGGRISWIDFKGKRRDMQFKELAEYLTRKICAVYQVSPQDVGVVSDVNRSSAAVQAEMTKSKGLRTLMGVISEYVTSHVINEIRPEKDLKLWFDDDDLERRRTEWSMNQQQLVSGGIVINEWRAKQGLHPVPWGNTPLQGLRNWIPEEEEQGAGGMPAGLPPLPGLAGMMNPGGPVGGGNPMSGQPASPATQNPPVGSMMKSKYFGFNKHEENPDDLMIKHFSGIYQDSAKFDSFSEILEYPGGEALRKSVESYEHFVRRNPALGSLVVKSANYDPSDPLVFSRYLGNGVIELNEEDGDIPIFKAISLAAYDSVDYEKMESLKINLNTEDDLVVREAVEWAVFKSMDEGLKNQLYENFYKFKTQPFSDVLIERVGEILEI